MSRNSNFRTFSTLLLLILFVTPNKSAIAQVRCGTTEYIQKLRNEKRIPLQDQLFEKWLNSKIKNRIQNQSLGRLEQTTYTIPVVVHIIHNGEPIGTGTNLSDAQIISQIDVLNKDFQRLNADASNTPAEFLPVAGNMSVEFVLAKRSPQGLLTNGIVRVKGAKTLWSQSDDSELKAQSYWPAEDYMNVWVCNLQTWLGYTQFPVSNLPGLENSPDNRLTDGIVIWYKTFGSKDYGSFSLETRYDLGRTLTHETGHFFGLRHIWGDVTDCSGTDYVDDTPNQNGSTGGCPTTEKSSCDVNVHKMYQNYLDYTDDACMNLFTQDQVNRMISVLENSPRRLSLLSSLGWKEPEPVPNDLGITNIIIPQASVCSTTITPSIEIKNFGTNAITSAEIQLKINSVAVETKTFSLNLDLGASTTADFTSQVVMTGVNDFNFEILKTNGVTDGVYGNDTTHISIFVQEPIAIPYEENFNSLSNNWVIKNPDQLSTWQISAAPSVDPNNNAMLLDFYNYEDHIGEQDFLYTPVFDLSNQTIAYLTFDVAYARFQSSSNDALKVLALTDCDNNLFTAIELYNKSGGTLATADNTKQPFMPSDQNQWRKEVIDLSQFIGKSNVQLVFVATNGWGNNLYLDNVSITNTQSFLDLSLIKINNPSIVSCTTVEPKLVIQNQGIKTITNFKVKYSINNGSYINTDAVNVSLSPGNEQEISLSAINLPEGKSKINFVLYDPNNGDTDINSFNDALTITTVVNTASEIIPIRQNFNSTTFRKAWTLVNPKQGENWQTILTNYDNSLYFNSFNNPTMDDAAWLVTPLLDFSNTDKASVFFDRSYALNNNSQTSEELLVLASIGCGSPFDIVLYDNSDYLSIINSTNSWKPSITSDWVRDYVNLNSLAGQKDVRLAWVAVNGNGNNLYIDNIEFFTSDNSNPPTVTDPFRVYNNRDHAEDFMLTFNLPEQETVRIDVFDTLGRTIFSDTINNVLNQTYPVTFKDVNAGIYIVRVRTSTQTKTTKIFIGR